MENCIEILGARTHNLKNVNIKIHKNKLVVFTGVSGSGKSSLIIDTLFAYSKKQYLDALSSRTSSTDNNDYDVDFIHGIQAPIAMEQTKRRNTNPRSTVGTLTSTEAYLRLLFSLLGSTKCPVCYKTVDNELYCNDCGCYAEKLEPQFFSSNHKDGMCIECNGLGKILEFTENNIVPDTSKSLKWIWENAHNNTFATPGNYKIFQLLCNHYNIDINTPFNEVARSFIDKMFYGDENVFKVLVQKVTNQCCHEGIITYLNNQYKKTSSASRMKAIEFYLAENSCRECNGGKLKKESLEILINDKNYHDVQKLSISELIDFLNYIDIPEHKQEIGKKTRNEIVRKLSGIVQLGLSYLSLNRKVNTLSSGELQRLLLSQHITSDLTGVMYILDEPTIGLHEKDTEKLIQILYKLRDNNNSVIVIEHDENVIKNADYIVEIGPYAGKDGGKIVACGTIPEIQNNPDSLFIQQINNRRIKKTNKNYNENQLISFKDLSQNNIINASVQFPSNKIVCVTGVSGAGKSSLVQAMNRELFFIKNNGFSDKVSNLNSIDDVIYIDQKPIGGSSRSNTLTYTGLYDKIRELYSNLPQAKEISIEKANFSLNIPGGRCEKCKGIGLVEVDMYFLKNELVICEECKGERFSKDILNIKYKNKNINDVLNLSVEEAISFFDGIDNKLLKGLSLLNLFGLGYLNLGQSTDTFSGGESQRLKLIAELLKEKNKKTLFIFDEPTTGLHLYDIKNLIDLFSSLIQSGHSIIIIEHNMDIISHADYIIDIGPEGGDNGGKILFSGKTDDFVNVEGSYTSEYLRKYLNGIKILENQLV